MVFIALIYNSSSQNLLINDWYVCLHVLSKQLYVWNVYLSLLGNNLVIGFNYHFYPNAWADQRKKQDYMVVKAQL